MRIAISGTANQGKTTLITDFLAEWSNYKNAGDNYREQIKKEKLPHSKKATKDSQWKILNTIVDEMQKYSAKDYVVFDRCALDNLVYSLWCFDKQTSDIDKEFIDKCIPVVRESLKFLDIIFFLPITKAAPVNIKENGTRETDEVYVKEIDSLFKSLTMQYTHGLGKTPFFPAEDCPGIIEILGTPFERIQMIKWYLNAEGELIGGDPTAPDNLFNPENLEAMAELLKGQKTDLGKEKAYHNELEKIKDFVKKTKR